MPTGLTYPIADGTNTSIRAFMLECARQFGAMITYRDDDTVDFDKVLSEMEKQRDDELKRDEKWCAEAKEELERLRSLTDEQWADRHKRYYANSVEEAQKRNLEVRAENDRLNAALKDILIWTPPSGEHEEYKKFMIDQLRMSLVSESKLPDPEPLEQFREGRIEAAEDRYNMGLAWKKNDLTKWNNRISWMRQLFDALPEK